MLSSIRCHQLVFWFVETTPIFRGVDLHLTPGWTGVVGPNGAGKTTLLRLLSGELGPTGGTVERVGADAPVAILCAQQTERLDAQVRALGEGADGDAWRWMGLLGLDADALGRWPTLSPGERKRWQVAAALWREPDLLMLDEPTNHLDAQARELLVGALAQYRGIGLVVSHDRELLEALTSHTIRVGPAEPAGAALYRGSYDVARATWEAAEAAQLEARQQAKREQVRLRRQLADKRRERQSAESRIGASSRIKGPRDHDARSMAAKGRVQNAEAVLARRVAVLHHKVDRAARALQGMSPVHKAPGRSLSAAFTPAAKPILAYVDLGELRAGDTLLARDVNLPIRRDTRVAFQGPNGSGKTTLVRAVIDGLRIDPGRILYLPQDLAQEAADALMAETRRLPADELAHVMEVVAALGVPPAQLLASVSPSPGEARKLMLAHGLGRDTQLLILDEPTNHLDLPSVERLELMLQEYPGAIVLVSHDRRFARAVCDEVVTFGEGSLTGS